MIKRNSKQTHLNPQNLKTKDFNAAKSEIHEIEVKLNDYYNSIEIPKELDNIVLDAIKKGQHALTADDNLLENTVQLQKGNEFKMKKYMRNFGTTAAIVAACFVGTANLSPTFAQSLSDIPVLGKLVEVVTFRQFDFNEDTYNAQINTPVIEGLENKNLQNALNAKYLEENKALYDNFQKEVENMKTYTNGGHLGTTSGFEVKTDNDQILSIGRYVVNTVASSSTTITYDTIDKQNEILITLPSLFKDEHYIDVISENIKTQMKDRMANDENLSYWIAGDADAIDGFDKIDANQSFYITNEGKLVISFDKYAVGPGSMGIQEFEIPTDVLEGILVSNTYIH